MTSEVLDHEERRWAAAIAKDLAALDELIHPQLTYTHSNAAVDTKDSWIGAMVDGVVEYRGVERTDTAVVEFGDTAAVTGQARIEVHARGNDIVIECRYSSVWVRDGGRWQFFLWHNTPLPK